MRNVYEKIYKGKVAKVDEDDSWLLIDHRWHIVNGYLSRSVWIADKNIYRHVSLHNVLMHPHSGLEVDHINHDKLDNRRSNLRLVTHSQNCQNRRKSSRNTSGYIGIRKKKGRNKWEVQVTVAGKHFYIGYYYDLHDAVRARDQKAKELHGEFVTLNEEI